MTVGPGSWSSWLTRLVSTASTGTAATASSSSPASACRRAGCFEGGEEVGEEPARVVVGGVEGQPRDAGLARLGALGDPLAEQGGLAETRRRRDEHESRVLRRVEPFSQLGPGHDVAAREGDIDLRPQHGHSASIGRR